MWLIHLNLSAYDYFGFLLLIPGSNHLEQTLKLNVVIPDVSAFNLHEHCKALANKPLACKEEEEEEVCVHSCGP